MANLESDIIGRVNRLALRPTEKNALLPLMEAVSNSVHSITDLYDADASTKGRIFVRVVRLGDDPAGRVIGFDVQDNGIGFTEENFRSFRTPDSRWKEARGGKGVGRLAWLKVFDRISVDSTYQGKAGWERRAFDFRLSETDQILERDTPTVERAHRTIISFRGLKSPYENRCPVKNGVIENRIAAHFVPLFVAGNAPKVTVEDDGITEIETVFSESIVDHDTTTITIGEGDDAFPLTVWSLKCDKRMRFEPPAFNFAFIAGDSRSVIDYAIDDQLGLKALDREHVYIACASSPYLDQKVNSERTAFTLDPSEVEEIKRGIGQAARHYLRPYIEEAVARKVETTRDLIAENPQFLYLADDLENFAEGLQPNSYGKEEIFLEMSRARFRRQKKFVAVEKSIKTGDLLKGPLTEKVEEYTGYIADEKRGALAEYVTRRKAVLDLFETLLEYDDSDKETYSKEDALHQLFCPMRIDSKGLTIDDHNLWLLDDRLAFFNYFASDERLSNYTTLDSDERPDLAFFYNSCVAWREREDTDTVVIVEFKRPMREEYNKGKDPVQQVLSYVKRLKETSGEVDIRGRAIRGIRPSTSFHCYVVADITPQLEERIIGRFEKTPDGEGYFGYTTNPAAFVEIVPFGKVMQDARLRNAIFFQKLGITNTG
ncbi:ATP-binding protein [Methylobacterium sp. E-066]|uniref:ATP-binding protein n=1 Tax=Methylobacterium sp. E-066 TaxID=2836584 RepID=UPI001FBB6A54|nr:ATP-binding protein [Methylobacterium sp. E-066]MCJ2138672.1 ATP-binding protein [Methylobacterium sp. E-066]